jgi:hypothetical protein
MSSRVEIRCSTAGKIFPAIGPFLMAAIFGFFVRLATPGLFIAPRLENPRS